MANSENLHMIVKVVEADPIVANAKTKLTGFDALQPLHIARTGIEKTRQCTKDAESRILLDRTNLSFRPVLPDNALPHRYRLTL